MRFEKGSEKAVRKISAIAGASVGVAGWISRGILFWGA